PTRDGGALSRRPDGRAVPEGDGRRAPRRGAGHPAAGTVVVGRLLEAALRVTGQPVMSDATVHSYLDAAPQMIDTGTAPPPCRRYVNGPTLLLLPCFPRSGFTWRKLLPDLAPRFTCWVPDLPGLGESEWTDATDFSFPGQGRTLKALVDRLGLARYSVIAQDT